VGGKNDRTNYFYPNGHYLFHHGMEKEVLTWGVISYIILQMSNATEKSQRNQKIYLAKMGYRKLTDKKSTRKPQTYRELSQKHNLSITYLQVIVNRYRKRYRKEKK